MRSRSGLVAVREAVPVAVRVLSMLRAKDMHVTKAATTPSKRAVTMPANPRGRGGSRLSPITGEPLGGRRAQTCVGTRRLFGRRLADEREADRGERSGEADAGQDGKKHDRSPRSGAGIFLERARWKRATSEIPGDQRSVGRRRPPDRHSFLSRGAHRKVRMRAELEACRSLRGRRGRR
jgi:hypothetical protein